LPRSANANGPRRSRRLIEQDRNITFRFDFVTRIAAVSAVASVDEGTIHQTIATGAAMPTVEHHLHLWPE
jgi:hypothetical protein